jgi:hypothetical protein
MLAKSFGKIAVPTPGTLVRLTTDTTLRVARLRFAVVIGETGRVFLGVAGMNKANGTGVIKRVLANRSGRRHSRSDQRRSFQNRHLLRRGLLRRR